MAERADGALRRHATHTGSAMRIAIMGAGAVGCFYGARLARAGNEVTFIARGERLRRLRADGLTVVQDAGRWTAGDFAATDDPAAVGPVELVLFTTKAYSLDDAARAMRPLVGPETAVLPLLNGVDIAERVGAIVGTAPMLGGITYIACALDGSTTVRQGGTENRMVFGEPEGGTSERGRRIQKTFQAGGVVSELTDDFPVANWGKFVLVNCSNGVCPVTGMPMGPVLADPDTRRLFTDTLHEGVALAEASGVTLPADIAERSLAICESFAPDFRPSLLVDLERGRPLEVEALQGTAVRLGEKLGVPTPLNRMIHAALKLRAAGRAG